MARQPGPQMLSSFKALGIGVELAVAIAGLAILGYWADEYFDTEPWLVLTGTVLGVVGGSYNAFKQAQRMNARSKPKRAQPGPTETKEERP